jgi:hypothetical protein
MRLKILFVSLISCSTLFAVSCKKSDTTPAPSTPSTPTDANATTNSKIVGKTWNVTSFTANGGELIGSVVTSYKLTFTKVDAATGDVTHTMIQNGLTDVATENYTIRNSGKEISIDGDVLSISISGNTLTMEGNLDGVAAKIVAKN